MSDALMSENPKRPKLILDIFWSVFYYCAELREPVKSFVRLAPHFGAKVMLNLTSKERRIREILSLSFLGKNIVFRCQLWTRSCRLMPANIIEGHGF
jgi:hypothetical protein